MGVAFTLLATPAFAQTGEVPEDEIVIADTRIDERDIVVTASNTRQDRDETGQAITVVTQADLTARQTLVITDILRTTPGVSYARNGGVGGTSSLFIRGGDSSQTLVLIDGVRINDPSSPSNAVDFGNLVTGNIARIEVLRGPNSVIWGSQAIGGVVNIQTAEPTEALAVRARGEYGFRDTYQGVANISGATGPVAASFGGTYLRSDGISAASEAHGNRERDGYRNLGANGKIRLTLGAFEVDLRGFYSDGDADYDEGFPIGDGTPRLSTEQYTGYAGLNLALFDGALKNRLAYTRTDIDRTSRDPRPETFNIYDATGTIDRFEYQGVADLADVATLVFGAEHEEQRSVTCFGCADPETLEVRVFSVYGQVILRPFGGLTVTGGVRYDDNDIYGSETTFGANVAYAFGGTVLRGTYSEGFRAPSLSEALSPFGNRDLVPETAESYDIGVEQSFLSGMATASVTYFHRDVENLITSDSNFALQNLAQARIKGVEAVLLLRPAERFDVTVNYSWIDTESRTRVRDGSGRINFGNQLARRPAQTASVSADYRWPFGLATGATVSLVGDSFDNLTNTVRLDGYALADVRASFEVVPGIELYGRVENLFDEQYETAFRFGTIGRAGYGGVRVGF